MKEQEVLDKAIKTYGNDAQILLAIEEMSELTTELCHSSRGRKHKIPEEIADVKIMMKQLEQIFDCEKEVEIMNVFKVRRLEGRLKNER